MYNRLKGLVPVDTHTHSCLSHDAHDEPLQMAEHAAMLGIKHFALTDHVELEKFSVWDFEEALVRSLGTFIELSSRYDGIMDIYYGAELGQAVYEPQIAERVLAQYDFDLVLGSLHRTRSYPFLNKIPDTDEDRKRCLDEYYEELLALAEWGRFTTLSHLTFPLRFICTDAHGVKCREMDMTKYDTLIDKILETIISKDIALEVNSSGIRKGLGVPMPDAEYIMRYRNKGGRLVSVGSDAHRICDIGADIPTVLDLLRGIGFSEVCVFRRKEPVMIGI